MHCIVLPVKFDGGGSKPISFQKALKIFTSRHLEKGQTILNFLANRIDNPSSNLT
jgi:hypothetical protein